MLTLSNIGVRPGELSQIVESVFRTMVSLEVSQSQQPWSARSDLLTARINMTGEWNGCLTVECSDKQACALAARFLSIEEPEIRNPIVRDVLGELTNMIGGNLKCVLAGGLKLSMPTIIENAYVGDCTSGPCQRLVYESAAGVFSVSIMRNGQAPDLETSDEPE